MEKIIFKCKPTYNFQSVEFEYHGDLESLDDMMVVYEEVLKRLVTIAPEQPAKVVSPIAKAEIQKPTDKQYEIMDKFRIKYTDQTTRKEAQALIQQSMDELQLAAKRG